MIQRDRPSGLSLFLALRGSVLPRILPALIVNIAIASLVTWSHGDLFELKITLTTIPFTLIGLPLSIFLGFRNNAAYDRFWEGRKLWGELVLRSRNFARQCLSLTTTRRRRRPAQGWRTPACGWCTGPSRSIMRCATCCATRHPAPA